VGPGAATQHPRRGTLREKPLKRLLLISNGHGEDFIAARLGEALRRRVPDLDIEAFPLVGVGEELERAGLRVAGPRRRLPADGFTMHDPRLIWRDLRAGLVRLTLQQAAWLRGRSPDAVLVVGDVYAQMHAALVRAPRRVLQPLVSVHHRAGGEGSRSPLRYFMERFRGPELHLLKRAAKVYTRDAATAAYLTGLGVSHAAYLGNPMMDGLAAEPLTAELVAGDGVPWRAALDLPTVALLPGSREQAPVSVSVMLAALLVGAPKLGLVAWTHPEVPALPPGWQQDEAPPPLEGLVSAWRAGEGGAHVWWLRGRFAAVLASARAALGTAGTANEQAVGLGLPVVAFEVPPLFGRDYLRNQARLLGDGLLVCSPEPAAVAHQLEAALSDERVRELARAAGAERMGRPGASDALADDLAEWLVS